MVAKFKDKELFEVSISIEILFASTGDVAIGLNN